MEKKIFLVILLFCSFFAFEANAQNRTIGDLFLARGGNKKDTIINVGTERYRLDNKNCLRNVKNEVDTMRRSTNLEEVSTKNNGEWSAIIKKVFSRDRFNELKQGKNAFAIQGVCDSTGRVKECVFLMEFARDIKFEEIVLLEKELKELKLVINGKIPSLEYYDIYFPCVFR